MTKRTAPSRPASARLLLTCTAMAAVIVTLAVGGVQGANPGAAKIIVQMQTNPRNDSTSFDFVFTRPSERSFDFSLTDRGHKRPVS